MTPIGIASIRGAAGSGGVAHGRFHFRPAPAGRGTRHLRRLAALHERRRRPMRCSSSATCSRSGSATTWRSEPGFAADCAAVLQASCRPRRPSSSCTATATSWSATASCRPAARRCCADPTVLGFAGKRWLLTHGDALCLADTEYMRFREQVRAPAWQREFLAKPLAQRQAIAREMREQSEARKRSAVEYADVDSAAAARLAGGGRRAGADPRPHAPARRPRARSGAPAHRAERLGRARRSRRACKCCASRQPALQRIALCADVRLAAQAPRGTRRFPTACGRTCWPAIPSWPQRPAAELQRLRRAGRAVPGHQGIPRRQWPGDHGRVALAIAAQAVLPVLNLRPGLVRRLRGHRGAPGRSAWRAARSPTKPAWSTTTTKCWPAKPWKAAR